MKNTEGFAKRLWARSPQRVSISNTKKGSLSFPHNQLHERTSVIITTNKAPTECADTLNDTVLATAILDRVIKLSGISYRLENRKAIFDK